MSWPSKIGMNISSKRLNNDNNLSLQSITAKTVQEAGMKYIYDRCPVIAAVGPVENLTDYNIIRAAMYWIRY